MSRNTISDQELVALYTRGDENALEELVKRYRSKIYTTILLQVKDSSIAEDIFQDAFIKVINTLRAGKYNEEGKFLPWVIRIAQNLVIDHFRKEKRTPVITTSDGFDIFKVLHFTDGNVEDKILHDQACSDLRKLILKLPGEQREVLIMRHYADLSFKEIADITDVSINTALGRMRYALNNLRKMLKLKELSLKQ
ncbi:RNA polymerase ECF family sigma subunit [Anseongella ginsenosidimutans]|uniref:RNA polymerase ECF family sigma subunit n=1 Tax=Anseongella ginsenosidimutans TaxID=496056 RepID=A0A4R3KPA8_9SPHI|nr:sigma-70 family RNA polymerase sigma factor [Anseongella ginsenosidimutans]QEC52581.1 sigma-70 family RNA polymerase sigma factor [Anseongella ginsenosidimutans]TCS86498.1 RNA polymerase ECF family sigma subunit [Anseongella ginsenosidimutans]